MENYNLSVFLSQADEEIADSNGILDRPNICKRIVTENITVAVTEMVPCQEIRKVCTAFPPRCKVNKEIRLKAVNNTEIQETTREIQECCDGYEKKK